MAIKLYIGPSLAYSVTPHANPPTFNEAIHNASLNVKPTIHPISGRKYLRLKVTVNNDGDDATDVSVRLFALTTSNEQVQQASIDRTVFDLIRANRQTEWTGLTIVTPTWTSPVCSYYFPNDTDPMCIVAATLVCPNMTPSGPSIAATTQDQCVGIYVIPTGYGTTAALREGSNPSGIGVATSLGLLGLNWIIDRRDRLRNGSSDSAGILIDPKKRNGK